MFVGIVNCNAVLYLWDQFFMMKWNTLYIEHATKAILYLLRDQFMAATDYDQMRKVSETLDDYTLVIETFSCRCSSKNLVGCKRSISKHGSADWP